MKKILVLLLALGSVQASAFFSPVGISVYPPVAFPGKADDIFGARVNLIKGVHRSVYGFDLGLVNHSDSTVGVAVGFTNSSFKKAIGLQIGTLNATNNMYGIQAGLFNGVTMFLGGPKNTIAGIQLGLINAADNVYGLQFGVINYAKDLHGIQIGVLNINKAGPFKALPLINIGF